MSYRGFLKHGSQTIMVFPLTMKNLGWFWGSRFYVPKAMASTECFSSSDLHGCLQGRPSHTQACVWTKIPNQIEWLIISSTEPTVNLLVIQRGNAKSPLFTSNMHKSAMCNCQPFIDDFPAKTECLQELTISDRYHYISYRRPNPSRPFRHLIVHEAYLILFASTCGAVETAACAAPISLTQHSVYLKQGCSTLSNHIHD